MREWLKKWIMGFWDQHGERLVFIFLYAICGVAFWFMTEMRAEAKAILMMIPGLFINKARSPKENATTTGVTYVYPTTPEPANGSGPSIQLYKTEEGK